MRDQPQNQGRLPVSAPQSTRLAIVGYESDFLVALAQEVRAAGWQVRSESEAPKAADLVLMKLSALVLEPEVLGKRRWDYIEQICKALPDLGVLICSDRSLVGQRVRALHSGVDDWITKPCAPLEVLARIEAISRRQRRLSPWRKFTLRAGELEIRAGEPLVGGRGVDFTPRELDLLRLLAEAEGRVIEREAIYQGVWGYAMPPGDRSVDVFVRKVRNKLRLHSPSWSYIHTHFGAGYRFDATRRTEAIDNDMQPSANSTEALPEIEGLSPASLS